MTEPINSSTPKKKENCSFIMMKSLLMIVACALPFAAAAKQVCISFDDLKPGISPRGWEATETGIGTAHWTVEKDVTAPSPTQVLKQSGEAQFPVCIYQKAQMADGFVEVKFKAVSGSGDQAAGVMFRVKDKDNYYVFRANASEDNVELFHMLHGNRESVKGADIKVTSQQWHRLRAEFHGTHITAYYDGKLMLEADDESLKGPGKVGLWTKWDSVTLFDDFCFGDLK